MNTASLFTDERTILVDIAIPLPINDPYTYKVPKNLEQQIQPGMRVKIPFKNRVITGYTVAVNSDRVVENPKEVIELLDPGPVVSEHFLRLTKWMSEYYFSSWGEAISNTIPKILKKGKRARKEKTSDDEIKINRTKEIQLNHEQQKAFSELKNEIEKTAYSEIFIFGVTGCGKSELYIRAIKEVLKNGKGAICLVPEIALTEQLKRFFIEHFCNELEILHSKLTDSQRREVWHRIRSGEKKVVLGARSAIFAPVKDLGIIVIDEEQEGTYKQDQTPRYHAREVARWRAQDLKIPLIMGTATPTLETMHRVKNNEVKLITLLKRFDGRPMPEVKIIDLKETSLSSKYPTIISPRLKIAVEQTLSNKSGVLLMLNRRGFSTHIQCVKCSNVFQCPYCSVALTHHQNAQKAICHYCNFHLKLPDRCDHCKQPLLQFSGVGTEKVESEIARLFPSARIGRLDADIAQKRGAHESILKKFRDREIDILVGTQMIAKGFDFPHVTLVGIINADTGLSLPDFRSSERTFQLLTQMAGRSGRGKEKGTVLIQTFSPHHYAIQKSTHHDYMGFYEEEIMRRKTLNYPPFSKLINVMFRGKLEQRVYLQALEFRKILEDELDNDKTIELIGPAPLPFYRLRGQFRWHLMLRGNTNEPMQKILNEAMAKIKRKQGIFVLIDVDPVSIL